MQGPDLILEAIHGDIDGIDDVSLDEISERTYIDNHSFPPVDEIGRTQGVNRTLVATDQVVRQQGQGSDQGQDKVPMVIDKLGNMLVSHV